ncbi:MAG: FecR domain-containing protein [Ginsengibacter sp.]
MPDYTQYKREDFLADESFANYLLQKNEKDIHFWESWIRDNPQYNHEIEQARLLFFMVRDQRDTNTSPSNLDEINKAYSLLRPFLHEKNQDPEYDSVSLSQSQNNSRKPLIRRILWQAASVAAVIIITVSLWNYYSSSANESTATELVLFAKTDNLSRELILPDGSQIQLNTFSSIKISKDFNHKKREVSLTGSAFFKVHKDHSKPFIVTSGNIKTTALGTAFYIYNLNPKTVSVSLLEGKVRVQGTKNYVELLPGEKAISDSGERVLKNSFNKNQLLDFTKGNIEFDHAGLGEIKTVIEEYFNREVVIEGNAPELNFTGNFDPKKLETILDALQFTYNIKYSLEKQKVTISFN